jgi:DNA-binding NarL/FixJ family response regulator
MSNKHLLPASLIDYYSSNKREQPMKIAIIGSDRFAINCLNELLEKTPAIHLIGLYSEHSEQPDQTVLEACDFVLVDDKNPEKHYPMPQFNGMKTLIFNQREVSEIGSNRFIQSDQSEANIEQPVLNGQQPLATGSESSESVLKMKTLFSHKYGLSRRESDTLYYLVNGYSYKMIASEMYISIDTVRSHIKRIYQKLGINSIAQAIRKVMQESKGFFDV